MRIHNNDLEKALRWHQTPPTGQMEASRDVIFSLLASRAGDATFGEELSRNVPASIQRRWSAVASLVGAFALVTFLILTSGVPSRKSAVEEGGKGHTLRQESVPPLRLSETVAPARFDVVSIRTYKAGGDGRTSSNLRVPGGRVVIRKTPLRLLVMQAYLGVTNLTNAVTRILALPEWADSEDFDIEAVAEGNPSTAEKRLMLQSLLADRFSLRIRRESQSRPVYALVIARAGRTGQQLRPHANTECIQAAPTAVSTIGELVGQYPCGRVVSGISPKNREMAWAGGRQVTIDMIVESIGGWEGFERPIVNRTGLAGEFDFTIEWQAGVQRPGFASPGIVVTGTSLMEALQDQLGLRMVAQTAPVEVFIVEHVERPTPN